MKPSNKHLKALRDLIVAQFEKGVKNSGSSVAEFTKGRKGGGCLKSDIIAWLAENHREETMAALEDLVDQAVDRYNDELRVTDLLEENPALRDTLAKLRNASEETGVGTAYLLPLTRPDTLPLVETVLDGVEIIDGVRCAEALMEAESSRAELDRVLPVIEGNPTMTMREAMRKLERRTDETLRELDGEEAGPND
jgi:hypothetical protein